MERSVQNDGVADVLRDAVPCTEAAGPAKRSPEG